MLDLFAGAVSVATGAVLVGIAVHRVSRGWSHGRLDALVVLPMLILAADLLWLRHELRLTRVLPVSNLVVVGNLVPFALAVLVGILARRFEHDRGRRVGWSCALAVVAAFSLIHPLVGRLPQCGDRWEGDFCRQTTPVTCSAAAACTVLAHHGIRVDEATMARDCLTRMPLLAGRSGGEASPNSGTTWQGLYRGLELHTHGTGWDVVARHTTLADLDEHDGPPLILFVELKPGADADPRYENEWGWVAGRRHTVVFFGFRTPDRARIGDPSVGLEEWSRRDLEVLWHGGTMQLVPR